MAAVGLTVMVGAATLWAQTRAQPPGEGPIAILQTLDQHALAFSPTERDMVFFGHHNGILRSEDGGRTWKALVERRGFDAMQLAAAGRANPRRLYLAGHDVFQSSDDGGVTWRAVPHNLPGTDIHQFTLSPDDPNSQTAVIVGFGMLRSVDGGRTWSRLPVQPPGDLTALASAGGNPETLYAGTAESGVFRSADEGRSWVRSSGTASPAEAFRTVLALAVDPTSRGILYAGTDAGLSKSEDGGATWTAPPYPGDNAVAVALSPVAPGVVLAVSTSPRRQGLVYRSEDGGLTWGAR